MRAGRDEIGRAYRDDARADDYVASRYERDPFGAALHRPRSASCGGSSRPTRWRRLLEVAPGPGRLTVHMPRVECACAVEQSPAMLRIAAERLRAPGGAHWRLIRGDAFHLPFEAGGFDAVMAFKLIRHFAEADRRALLAEVRRVLCPGGLFLLDVVNAPANRWLLDKWGVAGSWVDDHWFTEPSFRQEMAGSGFQVVRMDPVHPSLRLQYYTWAHLGAPSPRRPRR